MAVALSVSIALAGCGDTPTSSTYSPLASPRSATHVVVEGDTLYRIANEFGVSVGRLMAANQLSDPRELRVGQVLTIPGAGYRAVVDRHRVERGAAVQRRARVASIPVAGRARRGVVRIRNSQRRNA